MPTFVLIGHCGADSYLLKGAIVRAVPGVSIVFADDEKSLQPHLQPGHVLLVNRELKGGFDSESGVALIVRLSRADPKPVTMLVSSLADAQASSREAGAMSGFGKRDVNSPRTAELLRAAAAVAAQPEPSAGANVADTD